MAIVIPHSQFMTSSITFECTQPWPSRSFPQLVCRIVVIINVQRIHLLNYINCLLSKLTQQEYSQTAVMLHRLWLWLEKWSHYWNRSTNSWVYVYVSAWSSTRVVYDYAAIRGDISFNNTDPLLHNDKLYWPRPPRSWLDTEAWSLSFSLICIASVTQATWGGSTFKHLNSAWGKRRSACYSPGRPYPRLG